jgi:hypothetical protein
MTIEWHRVTAYEKPPQNRCLLWAVYFGPEDSPLFYTGVYRFDCVETGLGRFDLNQRQVWWSEIRPPTSEPGPELTWSQVHPWLEDNMRTFFHVGSGYVANQDDLFIWQIVEEQIPGYLVFRRKRKDGLQ